MTANISTPTNSCNRPQYHRASNVVFLRRPPVADPGPAYQALTHRLVMEKHRRGELPASLLEYLLAGAGLQP